MPSWLHRGHRHSPATSLSAAAVGPARGSSERTITYARYRTSAHADRIQYMVVGATDAAALLALGPHSFDAALCNMTLFDTAEIASLMRALRHLLQSGGRFVSSVLRFGRALQCEC